MNDLMNPPAMVQGIVSNYERAIELVQEAQSYDTAMKTSIRTTGDDMIRRGNALIKAVQLAGKEKLADILAKGWKGPVISTRTARRYMKLATEKAVADMVSAFESHTHKQLDGKIEDENSDDEDGEGLSAQERKVLISLIASVKPGLAKKLRDGTKKMTDKELKEAAPVSCSKCSRLGWPGGRPCEQCKELRKPKKQGSLLDGPEGDPLEKVRKLVVAVASLLTKTVNDNAELYRAFVACGLVDHVPNGPIRVLPFAGVGKLIEVVKKDEGLSDEKIKQAYQGACGTWVPEYVRHARAKKAMRGNK